MSKASLKNYRQSPRKVRLVADSIRGKKVEDALNTLRFMPKRAAAPMQKLVESALSNAKDNSEKTDDLIVKEITVDEGVTLKRWRPKWRGTAHPIRKRTSHVKITLATKNGKAVAEAEKEVKEDKKPAKKAVKKTVAKKTAKKAAKKTAKKVTKK
jgi:large subunit ribosomal protein L22